MTPPRIRHCRPPRPQNTPEQTWEKTPIIIKRAKLRLSMIIKPSLYHSRRSRDLRRLTLSPVSYPSLQGYFVTLWWSRAPANWHQSGHHCEHLFTIPHLAGELTTSLQFTQLQCVFTLQHFSTNLWVLLRTSCLLIRLTLCSVLLRVTELDGMFIPVCLLCSFTVTGFTIPRW